MYKCYKKNNLALCISTCGQNVCREVSWVTSSSFTIISNILLLVLVYFSWTLSAVLTDTFIKQVTKKALIQSSKSFRCVQQSLELSFRQRDEKQLNTKVFSWHKTHDISWLNVEVRSGGLNFLVLCGAGEGGGTVQLNVRCVGGIEISEL